MTPVDAVVRFYERLTPATLADIRQVYAPDARFRDPFNDVIGVDHVERIFAHMFDQLTEPRFEITGCFAGDGEAMLRWCLRWGAPGAAGCIEGASHLRFDGAGRVSHHRDYWDPAEHLYEALPIVGKLLRCIKRRLATP
ncbi:nuclear transport factor 2 family protein [Nitrogeniibacter mangrovi]|uniref:Nuclear transport factor 2 family protein n=1 Tax=Nitrogeniibacter mangrovi TaxID=2016596 RepID=A0A6C1B0E0_9RHOO|nr:nuclear transport factor 2 family protein [Nitrogeniibacter mangrovi]QID17081.1 nuclear transport factor 2 family protein [Nitrogeniibacter mangrovi]